MSINKENIPRVIVVEGPDGVGKTSIVNQLKLLYAQAGKEAVVVDKLPSSNIRDLVLSNQKLHPVTIAALVKEGAVLAAKLTEAALFQGKNVIMDRGDISWNVYQFSQMKTKPEIEAAMAIKTCFNDSVDCGADVVIFLMAPPEVLLERLKLRGTDEDRMEKHDIGHITAICDVYSQELDRLRVNEETQARPAVLSYDVSDLPPDIMASIIYEDVQNVLSTF